MVAHCRAEAPNEACGILAGNGDTVAAVHCLENAKHSPSEYDLTAEGYLLVADLDDAGQLLGCYHSHTHGAAYPSVTDRRLAFWMICYVIVSLAAEQPVLRAFRLSRDASSPADALADVGEEAVEIV